MQTRNRSIRRDAWMVAFMGTMQHAGIVLSRATRILGSHTTTLFDLLIQMALMALLMALMLLILCSAACLIVGCWTFWLPTRVLDRVVRS
jgi:hypothetical protein